MFSPRRTHRNAVSQSAGCKRAQTKLCNLFYVENAICLFQCIFSLFFNRFVCLSTYFIFYVQFDSFKSLSFRIRKKRGVEVK